MRINGKRAVVLALSPIPNGDVIKMGKQVHEQVDNIMKTYPAGYPSYGLLPARYRQLRHSRIHKTCGSDHHRDTRRDVAMGWRRSSDRERPSAGNFGNLVCSGADGDHSPRTTLGAFIVALGILVDDAVVVGDLILVRIGAGSKRPSVYRRGAVPPTSSWAQRLSGRWRFCRSTSRPTIRASTPKISLSLRSR